MIINITKRFFIVRVFCISELCLLVLYYLFGAQGLYAIKRQEVDNKQLKAELMLFEQQVQELQAELETYTTDPFFKEALARKLHYAYPHEELYIVPTHV